MIEWLIFGLIGIFSGLSAGLLGLGGGVIIVPALIIVFSYQAIPETHLMQFAVGTSLMTITVTSLSAMWAHHRQGTVDWLIFKQLVTGLLLGGISGAFLASYLSSDVLQRLFAIYILIVAFKMLLAGKKEKYYNLPGKTGLFLVGTGIGSISAILGIGGGSLTVPYLVAGHKSIHQAIGTAAACGFPIAVAGVVGFMLTGSKSAITISAWHTGFINWQAFLGIIATSILFAPIGAKLAKKLPVTILKQIFSIMLFSIGLAMLWH